MTQLSLSESFDCQLGALEKRCGAKREYNGLLAWTPIFRGILGRLKSRDKAVQIELMQVEHEMRSGSIDKAVERLNRAKWMLSCMCLGISVWLLGGEGIVRRRGGVRVSSRIVYRCRLRKGGEDYFFEVGGEELG